MQQEILTLRKLVNTFKDNIKRYKSNSYDEANTRVDFIDKFFELFGWDIRNEQGYSEDFRDVVREDRLYIAGKPKAPDYSFRIGGKRIFFVEAKKPSIYIKEDIVPAFQLRRYAYTAKLPLSILTDFEELAIYDTRIKPDKNDKASTARIFYCTYEEYEEKFGFLYNIISKPAVLKGSFNRYAEENKNKKGTSEVDKEFLKLIEEWRNELAKNIALRNKDLNVYSLNNAVQLIIDRIIFLRIAEDRNTEHYNNLNDITSQKNIYIKLDEYFKKANQKYNSGLFKTEKWLSDLIIDDKIFQTIVKSLYYPECPYELSVLPIEILGNIYEQFLGQTIRLTESHQAKIEEKPEVRKSGGVFYTPQYIVNYIVENTVGEKIKKLTPEQIKDIKILDPACGSGSFLVGAYNFLLNNHLNYYTQPKIIKKALKDAKIYQISENTYRLTILEKQKILTNNIYGVDIDSQAVEVTKLSLLLKLMENEAIEYYDKLFKDFKLLPDLSANIKCGNSLVESNYFQDKNISLYDEIEKRKINVFDWKDEFNEIINNGGFDIVLGNPPYVRQELISPFKSYFQQHYDVYSGASDIYSYFFEKGMSLLKTDGLFSIIVANKWLRANYGKPLRTYLKKFSIQHIIDFGDLPVFQGIATYPCIITIKKNLTPSKILVSNLKTLDSNDLKLNIAENCFAINPSKLNDESWILSKDDKANILTKLEKHGISLEKYVNGKIYYGIKTGLNEAFVIDEETKNKLTNDNIINAKIIKPFMTGRDVKRYMHISNNKYLILIPNGWTTQNSNGANNKFEWLKNNYLATANYLKQFEDKASIRYDKGEYWWELRTCYYYNEFDNPKIITPAIVQKASYCYDDKGIYSNDKTTIIAVDDLYLLGLLNSKAVDFYMHQIASTKQGGYYEYKPMYLKKLPIHKINTSDNDEYKIKELIISNVKHIISLNKKLTEIRSDSDKLSIEKEKNIVEKQINSAVYNLYKLTDSEIHIIESNL